MTGGKLDTVGAISILHYKFPAVIFIRVSEKQCRRKVSPDSVPGARYLPDGIVHVGSKGLAALVAVKQGREYPLRQCSRNEESILTKRGEDNVS